MNNEAPTYYTDKHAVSMALRDYFAAEAMNGYISGVLSNKDMATQVLKAADRKGMSSEQYFAEKSYAVADAMLEAREQ